MDRDTTGESPSVLCPRQAAGLPNHLGSLGHPLCFTDLFAKNFKHALRRFLPENTLELASIVFDKANALDDDIVNPPFAALQDHPEIDLNLNGSRYDFTLNLDLVL